MENEHNTQARRMHMVRNERDTPPQLQLEIEQLSSLCIGGTLDFLSIRSFRALKYAVELSRIHGMSTVGTDALVVGLYDEGSITPLFLQNTDGSRGKRLERTDLHTALNLPTPSPEVNQTIHPEQDENLKQILRLVSCKNGLAEPEDLLLAVIQDVESDGHALLLRLGIALDVVVPNLQQLIAKSL